MVTLENEKLEGFFNDENNPIKDINEETIIKMIKDRNVDFEKAYYSLTCESCGGEKVENERAYKFLEYHFYIYTKDGKYVTNSLAVEEEGKSFNRLQREGLVDNSYIVSIIVCAGCGAFNIEIEEFEI